MKTWTVRAFMYGVLSLGFAAILFTDMTFAARCDNFHSKNKKDNRKICDLVKAGSSKVEACVLKKQGYCVSACSKFDAFKEDCLANQACQWHPTHIVNPCKERKDGWVPVMPAF